MEADCDTGCAHTPKGQGVTHATAIGVVPGTARPTYGTANPMRQVTLGELGIGAVGVAVGWGASSALEAAGQNLSQKPAGPATAQAVTLVKPGAPVPAQPPSAATVLVQVGLGGALAMGSYQANKKNPLVAFGLGGAALGVVARILSRVIFSL